MQVAKLDGGISNLQRLHNEHTVDNFLIIQKRLMDIIQGVPQTVKVKVTKKDKNGKKVQRLVNLEDRPSITNQLKGIGLWKEMYLDKLLPDIKTAPEKPGDGDAKELTKAMKTLADIARDNQEKKNQEARDKQEQELKEGVV